MDKEIMSKVAKSKIFWNEAGMSGLIIGGLLSLATLVSYFLKDNVATGAFINNIILLAAFIVVPYILGKKFRAKNSSWGLTYQRALAYMLVIYLLAGFIFGVSTFLIYNLDTEYYLSEAQKLFENMNVEGVDGAEASEAMEIMIKSPSQMAFSFMMTLPFLAFLPALIISALIKSPFVKKDNN